MLMLLLMAWDLLLLFMFRVALNFRLKILEKKFETDENMRVNSLLKFVLSQPYNKGLVMAVDMATM